MNHEMQGDSSWPSLIKRRWRAMSLTFAGVVLAGGIASALMPKTYESTAKMLLIRTDQRMGGVQVVNETMPELTGESHPLYTQVELMRVGPLFDAVIAHLDLKDGQGRPLPGDQLAEHVKITPIAKTDLIDLRHRSDNPALAQLVLATLCDTYLQNTEKQRVSGVSEGLKYVDAQLETARKRLETAENKLLAYKRKSGSIALGSEIQASVTEVSALNSDIRAFQIQLASASARVGQLRTQLGMSAPRAVKAASQSPRLRHLRDQLVAAETSTVRTSGLGPRHPEVLALNQRVALLKAEIAREAATGGGGVQAENPLDDLRTGLAQQLMSAQTEVASLRASIAMATSRRQTLVAQSTRLPGDELALSRLMRDVQVASDVYQQLLQKREQARLAMSIAPTYAQVITPATLPEKPLSPLKGPTVPILAVLGLASAFAVGALREFRDQGTATQGLAQSLPELRIFAAVPILTRGERREGELIAETGTSPYYQEALRALAFAVEDQTRDRGGATIALTSTTAQEGKSVTLANLALCLAEAGHRVLLVDGDFRRARQHEIFGLSDRARGLSDVLAGLIKPFDAIRTHGSIDVVSAGGGKDVPRLAGIKANLGAAIAAWREEYTYVLIDLPPMALTAEVATFARATDGVLMLANLKQVGADTLVSGVQQLQALRVPVMGVIAISPMLGKPSGGYYLLPGEGIVAT